MTTTPTRKPLLFFWVSLSDRRSGTVEAKSQSDALVIAREHGKPLMARPLPYPADPRLGESKTGCPSFCYMPEKCATAGYCWPNRHRRRSCDD